MELLITSKAQRTVAAPFVTRVGSIGISMSSSAAKLLAEVLDKHEHVQVYSDAEGIFFLPVAKDTEGARKVQFVKNSGGARLNARPLAELLESNHRYGIEQADMEGVGVGLYIKREV